jgi:hypothetical protein
MVGNGAHICTFGLFGRESVESPTISERSDDFALKEGQGRLRAAVVRFKGAPGGAGLGCAAGASAGQARFLKRQLSLPVSTMSQW